MKKIGIIGSGQVAKVLGAGFIKNGYQVMIGTRDADKVNDWKAAHGGAVGTKEDAAKFGDLVVLAVKGIVAEDVIKEMSSHLSGKTVIDTTNPIGAASPQNGVLSFFTDFRMSLMERLQKLAPQVNFVKAF
ncbi:MAG: NADPH-dependent F420 reductase, partial [Bacteroidota bacterium]